MICLSPTGAVAFSGIMLISAVALEELQCTPNFSELNEITQGNGYLFTRVLWCENRAARGYQPGQISTIPGPLAIAAMRPGGRGCALMAQLELLRDGLVPVDVDVLKVIQPPASLAHHHE